MKRFGLVVLLLSAVAVGVFLALHRPGAEASPGATLTVDITADVQDASPGDGVCATAEGHCSLRAAIQETNALAGADSITLPAGTYALTIDGTGEDAAATGDLDITDDLTIVGSGADATIIDGNAIDRVLHVIGDRAVEVTGLTVRGGGGSQTDRGSGIRNDEGTLTLDRVVVSHNVAPTPGSEGGGVFNAGTLTVSRSSIIENAVGQEGGGIYSSGTLTVTESSISNNTASGLGGCGIVNHMGNLEITSSTLSGNTDAGGLGFGGGIYNYAGTATLTNTTVSGNHPTSPYGHGGGIANLTASVYCIPEDPCPPISWGGVLTLKNVTISNNSAIENGGGIFNELGSTVTLRNTIVADNATGGDCSGSMSSGGHNLDSDGSCNLGGPGDLPGTDPQLGALNDNGGSTQTHALLAGSPAIDAGSDDCPPPNTDQRGVARPQGVSCDIGAYEFHWQLAETDPVGGFASLPEIAGESATPTVAYAALGLGLAVAVLAATGAVWYTRKRRAR